MGGPATPNQPGCLVKVCGDPSFVVLPVMIPSYACSASLVPILPIVLVLILLV